jgi:hypothetical protein
MRTIVRRALVGAAVGLVALAAAVDGATASRISVSEQQIRATWSELSFQIQAGGAIRCAVTLEGSFHARTFAKTQGALVGYVTRALLHAPCTNGDIHFLNGIEAGSANTLPWHLRYDSFRGTLPNFTAVRLQLVGLGFYYTLMGTRCLYASTAASPIFVSWDPGIEEFGIPPRISAEGSMFTGGCLGTVTVGGSGRLTRLGETTQVRLTLA